MKPKYYCSDGMVRASGTPPPGIYGFYKDSLGSWHMTGFDDVAAMDGACVPIHEAIRRAVFTRQDFEDSRCIVESPFIYDAGIDAEARISKDQFERLLSKAAGSSRQIHQALYWQDYSFLVSNVQSGLVDIITSAGAFYQAFCDYEFTDIPKQERTGVRRTDSPETRFATLMLHLIFVRMHSVLDYLVKLTYEVDRQGVNYDIYPKLRGQNAQFGDRKRISLNKAPGTVFEECTFIRTIESIRTRILHDGHLSPNQWVYEIWDGSSITERYILFPDMKSNPGSFDCSVNRRSFYGDDNKINQMLPGMIIEFYDRTTLTLNSLSEKLNVASRW